MDACMHSCTHAHTSILIFYVQVLFLYFCDKLFHHGTCTLLHHDIPSVEMHLKVFGRTSHKLYMRECMPNLHFRPAILFILDPSK